jgi:hypothetical protein
MITSIGIPWFFIERLKAFSSTSRQLVSDNSPSPYTTEHWPNAFWEAVLAFQLSCTSLGYIFCAYYFWKELDSVSQAVFMGTVSILTISVGVAMAAAAVIHFGKSFGWMG